MMRIHKMVDQILKDYYGVGWPRFYWDFEEHPDNYDAEVVEKWPIFVQVVVEGIFEDPTIDMLAADFGLTLEEVTGDKPTKWTAPKTLNITYLLTNSQKSPGGVSWRSGGVDVYVPEEYVQRGDIEPIKETTYHEVAHYFDNVAGTIEPTSASASFFDRWMAHPDEQEAIKAEIYSLMNGGYTDEEVLWILMEDFEDNINRNSSNPAKSKIVFQQFLESAIEQIRASGEVLIEDEPTGQLPLFPSEAIVI